MARHDSRVGYGLPVALALALHVGVVVINVLEFPSP